MPTTHFAHVTFLSGIAALSVGSLAGADAIDTCYGDDLHGAIAAVSFIIRTSDSSFFVFNEGAAIQAAGQHRGAVSHSGTLEWEGESYDWGFDFSMTGETSIAPWQLTNTSPDPRVYLASIIFFASPRIAIDDGSEPSTAGSGPGFPEAQYISGPAIFNTAWDIPWDNPENAGDMWSVVLVQWAELPDYQVFPTGTTAEFILDADLVPAPGAAACFALALLTGQGRRRR